MSTPRAAASVALRPRGVLESSDVAIAFMRRHAARYARLWLVVALPGIALGAWLRESCASEWFIVWAVSVPLALLAEGPFTVLAGRLAIEPDERVRSVLKLYARRMVASSVLLVLGWLGESASVLIGFLGWFFVAPATTFVTEVALLEGGGFRSFGRATQLAGAVRGRVLTLVALLCVVRLGAIALGGPALAQSVGVLLDLRVHADSLFEDGGSLWSLVALWLAVPLVATIRYLAYIDLRTLREGWDLQRRFQLLAASLADGAP